MFKIFGESKSGQGVVYKWEEMGYNKIIYTDRFL